MTAGSSIDPAGEGRSRPNPADALAVQNPPPPPPPHPQWCGHCDERTRLREDPLRDGRPYRCPECHPLTTAPAAAFTTSSHAARSR